MNIKYHKRFEKRYRKLTSKDKRKVINCIKLFVENPRNKRLRNHALKGTLADKRAISAGPDLRLIFEESGEYVVVIFLDLGKHNRVYK